MMSTIVCGLDLGTTKVCAVIAEILSDRKFRVLGYGVSPSEGLTKGIVINISRTADSIREAVQIASEQAGIPVQAINVGVAGEHIMSLRHRNFINIVNDEHEITKHDLERLEEDVRRMRIPLDMQILHVIPEEFIVDSSVSVIDPVGMSASKLEETNHVVLASVPAIQNIRKSVERAGLQVNDFILQPL
ncbi:MAG: cell division protein FtsA, partial [Ignavibacteriales bacterium]|nr:cell division protein FtsA [Ignavibacteriales bacterium]